VKRTELKRRRDEMNKMGAFCETYGNTIPNRVLEYLMENQDLDFAVGDLAKELDISRPKAYEIIADFEKKSYVLKSRIVGKTQLYLLNKENQKVRLFLKDFKECLRIVAEEYSNKAENKAQSSCFEKEGVIARVFLGKIDIAEKIARGV
jgi:predicted DNA-binding protein YlxM (UPF0122 family)